MKRWNHVRDAFEAVALEICWASGRYEPLTITVGPDTFAVLTQLYLADAMARHQPPDIYSPEEKFQLRMEMGEITVKLDTRQEALN